MKKIALSFVIIFGGAIMTLVLNNGCNFNFRKNNQNEDPSLTLIKPLPDNTIIFKYRGGQINAADLTSEVAPKLEGLRSEVLNLYHKKAEALLTQRLLEIQAQKQGLAKVDDLFKTVEVTDTQVNAYIKANKLLPAQKEAVKTFLVSQMIGLKKQEILQKIRTEYEVQDVLGSARFDGGSLADLPSRGGQDPKVVIQEFCDFQNPLCSRSRIVLEEILKQHSEKVRWVYRHYPVDSHPLAKELALTSICGHKKDKFWPLHDSLFNSQSGLTKEKMETLGAEFYSDKKDFSDCLKSTDTLEILDHDISTARALDISSTPTFLVNGAKVTDFDELRKKVDAEVIKR